ncbi:MAG: tetratricopeptide repeat protein [Ignavibacteriae bacterium]|nr:tetratricopeptide repeat protein [Ignavibacteriota bacterium]
MKALIFLSIFIINCTLAFGQNNSEDVFISHFKKSVTEENDKNYKKAKEYISQLYDDNENNYLVNIRLGWLNYLTKDYKSSLKYYDKAAELSDNSTESLLGLTFPYYALGKLDMVEKLYERILEKDECNYTANLNLGQIYLNRTDYIDAKVLFEKLQLDFPSDYSANFYLAWTYYYLGSKSKAKKLFLNAIIAAPNDANALEGYNITK